jgi:hypothetical protein
MSARCAAVRPNKRMQLTKRGDLVVGVQDGLFFTESRFAADPRCWTAVEG